MDIKGSVALVTGANRGIGRACARALIEHGAATVYAGVREPGTVHDEDVIPLRMDVTKPEEIAAAAATACDASIVINNAGIGSGGGLFEGPLDRARQAMEVNYFGTWEVSRAFAPVLARNGGGALINIISRASWIGRPEYPGYAASKAAQWSLTNSLRVGLREQGTLVMGVHMAFVDTDMNAGFDAPTKMIPAAELAEQIMQALDNDWIEVLADEPTRQVKAALSQSLNRELRP